MVSEFLINTERRFTQTKVSRYLAEMPGKNVNRFQMIRVFIKCRCVM